MLPVVSGSCTARALAYTLSRYVPFPYEGPAGVRRSQCGMSVRITAMLPGRSYFSLMFLGWIIPEACKRQPED